MSDDKSPQVKILKRLKYTSMEMNLCNNIITYNQMVIDKDILALVIMIHLCESMKCSCLCQPPSKIGLSKQKSFQIDMIVHYD